MKKKLLFLALLLVAVALAIFRISDRVPSADYPLNQRVAAIFVKGGCLDCHSANPELPAYFKLPVVGKVMKKDVDEGYRAFDMEPMWKVLESGEGTLIPVDMAKVEKIYNSVDEMPEWAQEAVQELVDDGTIEGVGGGDLGMTLADIRLAVWLWRRTGDGQK